MCWVDMCSYMGDMCAYMGDMCAYTGDSVSGSKHGTTSLRNFLHTPWETPTWWPCPALSLFSLASATVFDLLLGSQRGNEAPDT